jgi:hypothetical protein
MNGGTNTAVTITIDGGPTSCPTDPVAGDDDFGE